MKFILISWLSLFSILTIAPNMQGAQLFKLGDMFHHFKNEHQENGITLASFLDFIKEHYSKPIDTKEKEHKNLPFKTINPTTIHLAINELKICPVFLHVQNFYETQKNYLEPNFVASQKLAAIWNPPRI